MTMMQRSFLVAGLALCCSYPLASQTPPPPQTPPAAPGRAGGAPPQRNFERDIQNQVQTDATWKAASDGVMSMEKTTYKSKKDGLAIPVFVFKPLKMRGPKSHAALVWVHPDIRGHVYEYYIPYVREAVQKGYIVVAPEYRGSYGYGQVLFDAIDYGGAEVDDTVTAVDYIKANIPQADPDRIGIIGWSHGGMISVLSATRFPTTFKCSVAIVPVTNLFQRLAYAGVESRKLAIDPANRYGGLPNQVPNVYKERSPLYQIEKLQIPMLVHVTKNDQDVHIEEDMQLVDALRSRKSDLAETKVYDNPVGGHLFDRQFDRADTKLYTPMNTHEQRDSWNRVWTFLDWHLNPYNEKIGG